MKIGKAINNEIATLSAGDDKARLTARIMQVQQRYKESIQQIYGTNAGLFLDHTNSVYIIEKENRRTLIVYVDESIYAAELNAQRELIRLHMHQHFGEDIQVFEIHVSRGDYKKKHPYKDKAAAEDPLEYTDKVRENLSETELAYIEKTVADIDNEVFRETLRKAMTADLKRCKQNNEGFVKRDCK